MYQYRYINKLKQLGFTDYTLLLIDDEGLLPDVRREVSFKSVDVNVDLLYNTAQNLISIVTTPPPPPPTNQEIVTDLLIKAKDLLNQAQQLDAIAVNVAIVNFLPDVVLSDPLTPDITFINEITITVGTPLSNDQLSGIASIKNQSIQGSFAFIKAVGEILDLGEKQERDIVFTPDDIKSYNSVNTTVIINVVEDMPVIIWKPPADINYGTPLDESILNAVARDSKTGDELKGTYEYNPGIKTILDPGTWLLTVLFTPADLKLYIDVSYSVKINVLSDKLTQSRTLRRRSK